MGTLEPETGYNGNTTAGWVTPPYRYPKSLRRRGGFYIRPRTRVNAICRYVARASATPPPTVAVKLAFALQKKHRSLLQERCG